MVCPPGPVPRAQLTRACNCYTDTSGNTCWFDWGCGHTACGRSCADARANYVQKVRSGYFVCGATKHTGGSTPPTKHCTPIMYNNVTHCIGDACGPGGTGAIYNNNGIGLCSRSNPPPISSGPGPNATRDQAIQYILGKGGLEDNTSPAYISQNRACLIGQLPGYSAFNDIQRVPFNSSAFYYYRNAIRDAILKDAVCTGDGGGKPPGSGGCHLGTTMRCPSTDPICNQNCTDWKVVFDLTFKTPLFSDEQDCRNKQAAAGCYDVPASPGGGDGGDFCSQHIGLTCGQASLIGIVAMFGIFVLVVLKR